MKLKLPFGAILPESQTPVSDTMSCVVESVFDHVMTPPCDTLTGLGANAAVPSVRALVSIVIVALDGAEGAGVGEGVDGVEELLPPPQPVTRATRTAAQMMRTWITPPKSGQPRQEQRHCQSKPLDICHVP